MTTKPCATFSAYFTVTLNDNIYFIEDGEALFDTSILKFKPLMQMF